MDYRLKKQLSISNLKQEQKPNPNEENTSELNLDDAFAKLIFKQEKCFKTDGSFDFEWFFKEVCLSQQSILTKMELGTFDLKASQQKEKELRVKLEALLQAKNNKGQEYQETYAQWQKLGNRNQQQVLQDFYFQRADVALMKDSSVSPNLEYVDAAVEQFKFYSLKSLYVEKIRAASDTARRASFDGSEHESFLTDAQSLSSYSASKSDMDTNSNFSFENRDASFDAEQNWYASYADDRSNTVFFDPSDDKFTKLDPENLILLGKQDAEKKEKCSEEIKGLITRNDISWQEKIVKLGEIYNVHFSAFKIFVFRNPSLWNSFETRVTAFHAWLDPVYNKAIAQCFAKIYFKKFKNIITEDGVKFHEKVKNLREIKDEFRDAVEKCLKPAKDMYFFSEILNKWDEGVKKYITERCVKKFNAILAGKKLALLENVTIMSQIMDEHREAFKLFLENSKVMGSSVDLGSSWMTDIKKHFNIFVNDLIRSETSSNALTEGIKKFHRIKIFLMRTFDLVAPANSVWDEDERADEQKLGELEEEERLECTIFDRWLTQGAGIQYHDEITCFISDLKEFMQDPNSDQYKKYEAALFDVYCGFKSDYLVSFYLLLTSNPAAHSFFKLVLERYPHLEEAGAAFSMSHPVEVHLHLRDILASNFSNSDKPDQIKYKNKRFHAVHQWLEDNGKTFQQVVFNLGQEIKSMLQGEEFEQYKQAIIGQPIYKKENDKWMCQKNSKEGLFPSSTPNISLLQSFLVKYPKFLEFFNQQFCDPRIAQAGMAYKVYSGYHPVDEKFGIYIQLEQPSLQTIHTAAVDSVFFWELLDENDVRSWMAGFIAKEAGQKIIHTVAVPLDSDFHKLLNLRVDKMKQKKDGGFSTSNTGAGGSEVEVFEEESDKELQINLLRLLREQQKKLFGEQYKYYLLNHDAVGKRDKHPTITSSVTLFSKKIIKKSNIAAVNEAWDKAMKEINESKHSLTTKVTFKSHK